MVGEPARDDAAHVGRLVGETLVEARAQAPLIALRVRRCAAPHLGGEVALGATSLDIRESEIGDPCTTIASDEDVVGFDVAMHEAAGVPRAASANTAAICVGVRGSAASQSRTVPPSTCSITRYVSSPCRPTSYAVTTFG
jgi:hypothetical protein